MNSSDKIQTQSAAQIATELRRSVVRLARRLRSSRTAADITPARLGVLRWLQREGAMSAGQIAAAEFLQPQSVTRLLSALEQDGLIARNVDEQDRRRAQVEITAAGIKMLRADTAQRDKWLADAMTLKLTTAERAILQQASALLDRLADESNR